MDTPSNAEESDDEQYFRRFQQDENRLVEQQLAHVNRENAANYSMLLRALTGTDARDELPTNTSPANSNTESVSTSRYQTVVDCFNNHFMKEGVTEDGASKAFHDKWKKFNLSTFKKKCCNGTGLECMTVCSGQKTCT
jgi:hypothetical protein